MKILNEFKISLKRFFVCKMRYGNYVPVALLFMLYKINNIIKSRGIESAGFISKCD